MNEKVFFVAFISCVLLFLSSCCTSSGVHNHRDRAVEVGADIGELGDKQTQSAITSTELKEQIDRSIDDVGDLEKSIRDGAEDVTEFKNIILEIRKRGKRGSSPESEAD